MRRLFTLALALMLALTLLVPASLAEEEVVLSLGKEFDPAGKVFPEGHDVENNYYLDFVKEKTGVSFTFDWVLADDESKINLAVASGTMPDVMVVNLQQFNMLIESDMIQPLTAAFEEHANDYLRNSRANNPRSFEAATVGGELMAIPNTVPEKEFNILWVRQDWLDKLGLEAPKTLEDLVTVAKAFIEQDPDGNGEDDTIGLTMHKDIISSEAGDNLANSIAAVFGSFGRTWYLGDDGKVVYGSVTSETRDALEYLAGLYADGIIDKQFAVREESEVVISGKCGLMFGTWASSGGTLRQSFAYDGADWVPVAAPLNEAGEFVATTRVPATAYAVVNKDCAYPEALVKAISASFQLHRYIDLDDEWTAKMTEYNDIGVNWTAMPISVSIEEDDIVMQRGVDMIKMIDEGITEGIKRENVKFYEAYQLFLEDPTQLTGWARYKGMYLGCNVCTSEVVTHLDPCFWGMTPTMEDIWTTLKSMEDETFIKIVMGESPIEAFDQFVLEWNSLGGEDIIQEVQEYLDARS